MAGRDLPSRPPALFRDPRPPEPFDEDVAMGELGQVPSNQAETERRVHPAAHGGEFLGLLHQAEMSAAANQRIVMTGVVRKGGNGRAKEGERKSTRLNTSQ